jgi:hypothetical protein
MNTFIFILNWVAGTQLEWLNSPKLKFIALENKELLNNK